MGIHWSCLDSDEYIHLDYPNGQNVKFGPGCIPFCCATGRKYKKPRLKDTEYLVVEHLQPEEGQEMVEVISGPILYEPTDPYIKMGEKKSKISLKKDQYIIVEDKKTGNRVIEEGPKLYTPGAFERCSDIQSKPKLTDTQYIVIKNEENGRKRVVTGPLLYTPGPYEQISRVQDMIVLNDTDYIYITHTDTGKIDIVVGPTKVTPGPYDKVSKTFEKIVLELGEYIKIVDRNTGQIRTEIGPATIILKQYEKIIDKKRKAIEINEHNAVYIKNIDNGEYELIKMEEEPFIFFPTPTQEIIERRKKIRLEERQAMVIKNKDGEYNVITGQSKNRAFFLPPYCDIYQQEWSTDLQKNHEQVKRVKIFDLKPLYMDYELLIITRDQVEIIIDINICWKIADIELMINTTEDPPEDICKHAQSQILSATSRIDMKTFIDSFNEIVHGAVQKNDKFYTDRGVEIVRIEITGRRCKDPETQKLFQQIISEKTARIKNIEKKQGENEVIELTLKGEVEQEKIRGEIVSVKKGYMREEAKADGEADADKVTNFISNLPEDMTKQEKLEVYYDQQNTERLSLLAKNVPQLNVHSKDIPVKYMNLNYSKHVPNIVPMEE